jgi:hypothetical protein
LTRECAAPSIKQRLAVLRHLLVNGQFVPINPAHTVRGPRHVVTWANAGARSYRSPRTTRQHRHLEACRPARIAR